MDFFLEQNNIILLTVAVVSGTMLLLRSARKGGRGASVNVQDAVQLVNRQQGIFIDIRTPEQYKAGTIPQARNVPQDQLEAKASSLPKDKPIILVCDSGQQAIQATSKLRKLGLAGAVSLQGGLRSWTQEGLPLTKKG